MAITKERKEELVSVYGELLSQATGIVLADYKNMSVAQVNTMRDKLREVQGAYVITKNTLFKIALKNAGWPIPEEQLNGPTGVIFGAANFPAVAKVAVSFIKDYEGLFVIKGGIMTGELLTPQQVDTVSNLPSLDELRAQLAGLISQPASGIVGAINGAVAAVPQVLQAYVSKHEAA
ncbi:MAG: 50S ribosomal protein L10 [Anaerolineae bacterium]|nr:50S ribosomal protein L10 [Anaerolineae bacterium]